MIPLDGSLIYQILKDGTSYGADYDGRLGILTSFLMGNMPIDNSTILDLGSNAGHFPIEYIRMGARGVIAVEGRPEFEEQWHELKHVLPQIDVNQIEWHCSDVRKFHTNKKYNIISCLGLVYHVNEIWEHLVRLAIPEVELIVIESELWPTGGTTRNFATDRTNALEDCSARAYSIESITRTMGEYFPEWQIYQMMLYGYMMLVGDDPAPKDRPRGLWYLKR